MSSVDPMFKSLPKNSTFFTIWRIEKMQIVQFPKDQYGTFYTGDSYIVVVASDNTEKPNCFMKSKKAVGALDIHIHFWLGAQTSQDEAGVAAYKTVELDDHLGGSPVQHREVQGFESQRFLSYFPRGIRIQNGGVVSGFKHVEDTTTPRMFHVKGKRRPIVKELPHVSWSLMNDGDVFVIDARTVVFVWCGRHANHVEKLQGAVTAQQLKAEHGEGTIVIVEDGQEKHLGSPEKEYLNHLLPLEDKVVKNHRDMSGDELAEKQHCADIKLYRCSDEVGTLRVTEVKTGPLEQKDLLSQDSYIVDNAEAGIWVWVGKKASHKERTEAMRNAQGFIKKKGYPHCTQVARVIEGGEPMGFKCLFRVWHDAEHPALPGKTHSAHKIAKTVQTKFDAPTLHSNPALSAQMQVVDDGTGKREVFRVRNLNLVSVELRDHGKFFSNGCYVIVYIYDSGTKEDCIVYYWLGQNASTDDKRTAALKARELDDRFNGQSVLVRLVQGKETPHFMTIFSGQMIVFEAADEGINGGSVVTNGNGVAADHNGGVHNFPRVYLLRVHGTTQHNTKAVQVPCTAASLNSGDVFLLSGGGGVVYVWAGRKSTGDEREMAKKIATGSGMEMVLVSEGQEKQEFWNAIGGRLDYTNEKQIQEDTGTRAARLFHLRDRVGRLAPREVVDFNQCDLVEDEVMLLDAWHSIFLWIGKDAGKELAKLANHAAEDYLQDDPSCRDLGTPVIWVKQGLEPPNFTGFFTSWDNEFWKTLPTYESIKNEIEDSNQTLLAMQQQAALYRNSRSEVEKFTFDALNVKNPDQLPTCVDPANKELYLNDEEFLRIFSMAYEEFEGLPKWKKLDLKKKVGLF
ncbi:advillin [Ixodes scapularis]|nr:advillin [Ixodes scapularis]